MPGATLPVCDVPATPATITFLLTARGAIRRVAHRIEAARSRATSTRGFAGSPEFTSCVGSELADGRRRHHRAQSLRPGGR